MRNDTIILCVEPIDSKSFKETLSKCEHSSITVALFYSKNKNDSQREDAIRQEIIKRYNERKERQV